MIQKGCYYKDLIKDVNTKTMVGVGKTEIEVQKMGIVFYLKWIRKTTGIRLCDG